jgi:hypothetical protein
MIVRGRIVDTPTDISQVARAIQLSLAPVFLLSGISVLLGVLTNRLARVVDRARPLEERHAEVSTDDAKDIARQLNVLARRARLMNAAITMGTVAALLIAIVVGLLFASAFIAFTAALPVAALFVAAMAALVGALIAFLIEIRLATSTLRIGPRAARS